MRNFGHRLPKSAVLYVTLEPCSTAGRTPACTTAIIKSGPKKIVIGAIDPNPRHAGRGLKILQEAGIQVEAEVLADECSELNEAFNKWIVGRKPFVIAKCAMTLDGRLTQPPSEPRWITSAIARRDAHRLRAQVDAILVGAETVRSDNPRLTVRGVRTARQPLRAVLTRSGNLPRRSRIFSDRSGQRTLVYKGKSLAAVLTDLAARDVTSVLIEGGGNVLGEALDAKLIDKVHLYLGPLMTGGPVPAFSGRGANSSRTAAFLERIKFRRIGQEICVTGYPRY